MRYIRQAYELSVPIKGGNMSPDDIPQIVEKFHDLHEKAYGYARRKEAVQFVNLRVTALGKLPEFQIIEKSPLVKEKPKPIEYRNVFFGGVLLDTPIYDRKHLQAGIEIQGPAVIEQLDSTILVFPDNKAITDQYDNLLIRQRE
jgi:N-methylhydantoinase A